MFRQAKMNASKLLAVVLAALILFSMIPLGVVFHVFAAETETVIVKLPNGISATVTLTDENDATNTFTANTNDSYEAVFENVDDATTYTLQVSEMELYKNYSKQNVAVSADTPVEILKSDLSEKDVQTISFTEDGITKTFGDEAFAVTLSEPGSGVGEKTYSSTNETVAKVNSNGIVTIIGAGTTEIKVLIATDENYKAAEDTLVLTVEQAENAISYTATSVNWVYNDIKTNVLTIKEGAVGSITYASDNDKVAKVNALTGEVMVLKPGSAKITATFVAGTKSNYKDSTASYEITAKKKADALEFGTAEINKTYGDGKGTNNTLKPSDITGTLSYDSSNKDVATIDPQTGEYTIVGAGTTTITATLADDDIGYDITTASYTLIVAKKENALSFEKPEQTYIYGDKINENTLTVALKELGGFTGPITYKVEPSGVVSVDEETGAITILKSGDATITASIAEEANYAPATASYVVYVDKKTISFDITETINYGEDDPDLADKIESSVIAGLVAAEKDDIDVIKRVTACISYEYPAVDEGDNRQVGVHAITFTVQDDDCYSFDLTGSLKVENTYDAEGQYKIEGLNSDRWGSVTNKVTIKVTDTSKYQIGLNGRSKKSDDWKDELVFDKEKDMSDYTFYIRDIQNPKKQKVSKAIVEKFGIDGTKPTVDQFDFEVKNKSTISKIFNYLTFGFFFNEEVTVKVTTSDKTPTSGVNKVTLYYNDTQYGDPVEVSKDNTATFTLTVDAFKTLKTVSAIAEDKVGNRSENTYVTNEKNSNIRQEGNALLQLEQNQPKFEIVYPDATSLAGENKWYGDDIEFKVKVTDTGEENSGIRSVYAVINGEKVEIKNFTNAAAETVEPFESEKDSVISNENGYYFINQKTEELNFTINTSQIDVPQKPSGKYTIIVVACDNAGNEISSNEIDVYIDRDIPTITGFEFNADKSIEGNKEPVVTEESYGYFFTEDTEVIVTAKDVNPSAGIKQIEFYTLTKDGARKDYTPATTFVDSSDDLTTVVSATFIVPKGFKGQLYARAVDKVEHTTANEDGTPKFFNPNGAAIEDAAMHKDHSAASISLVNNTEYKDNSGLPLYKWTAKEGTPDGIPVKLYVKDTFSGIKNITWEVDSPYNKTADDPHGTITVESYLNGSDMVKVGQTIDGWTVEAVDGNLVTEMSKVIYITNNSNDIKVTLSFNDRALNSSNDELHFSIDNTVPTIEVTYDNNTPDETYTDFFKADRKATIKITERNFNKNDVVYKITNTDGTIPSFSDWTEHKDTVNPDATYYTAEILYHADGDYTFDISYADLAKNKAADFAQHKFTIDQTMPTVSVAYDNMSALNGNYYKADRVATITIVEHNFDAARVTVIGTATDNGATVAFPVTSAWNDNGDTHTATIHYASDAKYSFDIEFNDKAGNSIADYAPEEFYVDKTAPTLEISGVADKSANNGTVAPVITFTDTNYNGNAISYTLTGVSNGKVNYSSSISDIANGQRVTFADFERIQKVDDIYILTATLTDMAGNETTKSITFSANRFGSVYDLATLEKIIGKYLQNEEDVVFTETNVDSLKKGETKIKLTKNGTPKDLVEGTDYTVTETGGNGQWSQYKYTINKALFTDDGRYSISVYSVDAAGNINENIDETKKAEISFGVDKTKPVIVPIDFENDTQYPVEVKTVSVEIKDNLVLEGVKIYLNGSEIKYNNDGEAYTFDIPEKNEKQNVRIVAVDAAGNEYELLVENFLVSTNLFVRWFNNTPLFIGSIAGVVILCGAIVLLVMFKRKKSSK